MASMKYLAGAAALYAVSTQRPFANISVISSTRRAIDSVMLVLYKTAAGTGRLSSFPNLCSILSWY